MYGQDMKEAARIMRRSGIQVQEVARALDVSAGWASKATASVRPMEQTVALLVAANAVLELDRSENGAGRRRRLSELSPRRQDSIAVRIQELRTSVGWYDKPAVPHWSSNEYRVLDRVQQAFAKDAQHPMFAMLSSEWPEMLSHLVEWKRVRRPMDRSESGFLETAQRVHDHVLRTGRPPSISDEEWQVQQDARWLWRWKCNANGRIGRKRNIERAQVFSEIAIVVEMLRSPVPAIYAEAKTMLDNGRWTALFRSLRAANDGGAVKRM